MVLEFPTIIFQYKYVLHTFVKWVLIFMDWQAEKEWNKNYFFKWSMFVFHGIFSIFLKKEFPSQSWHLSGTPSQGNPGAAIALHSYASLERHVRFVCFQKHTENGFMLDAVNTAVLLLKAWWTKETCGREGLCFRITYFILQINWRFWAYS